MNGGNRLPNRRLVVNRAMEVGDIGRKPNRTYQNNDHVMSRDEEAIILSISTSARDTAKCQRKRTTRGTSGYIVYVT